MVSVYQGTFWKIYYSTKLQNIILNFLESIICLDEETKNQQNFTTHDSVGGSWTDKVLNTKDEKGAQAHLSKESEGVDDDEWVSVRLNCSSEKIFVTFSHILSSYFQGSFCSNVNSNIGYIIT